MQYIKGGFDACPVSILEPVKILFIMMILTTAYHARIGGIIFTRVLILILGEGGFYPENTVHYNNIIIIVHISCTYVIKTEVLS